MYEHNTFGVVYVNLYVHDKGQNGVTICQVLNNEPLWFLNLHYTHTYNNTKRTNI